MVTKTPVGKSYTPGPGSTGKSTGKSKGSGGRGRTRVTVYIGIKTGNTWKIITLKTRQVIGNNNKRIRAYPNFRITDRMCINMDEMTYRVAITYLISLGIDPATLLIDGEVYVLDAHQARDPTNLLFPVDLPVASLADIGTKTLLISVVSDDAMYLLVRPDFTYTILEYANNWVVVTEESDSVEYNLFLTKKMSGCVLWSSTDNPEDDNMSWNKLESLPTAEQLMAQLDHLRTL